MCAYNTRGNSNTRRAFYIRTRAERLIFNPTPAAYSMARPSAVRMYIYYIYTFGAYI